MIRATSSIPLICYDLGFGTSRTETESNRMRRCWVRQRRFGAGVVNVIGNPWLSSNEAQRKLRQAGGTVINLFRTLTGISAVAVLGVVVTVGTPQIASAQGAAAAAQSTLPKKNLKDQGEYDIYNEVSKDVLARNFAKALTDLATWTQKYPESEYKDER